MSSPKSSDSHSHDSKQIGRPRGSPAVYTEQDSAFARSADWLVPFGRCAELRRLRRIATAATCHDMPAVGAGCVDNHAQLTQRQCCPVLRVAAPLQGCSPEADAGSVVRCTITICNKAYLCSAALQLLLIAVFHSCVSTCMWSRGCATSHVFRVPPRVRSAARQSKLRLPAHTSRDFDIVLTGCPTSWQTLADII